MSTNIKLSIDGIEVEVRRGANLVEAAKKVGIEIPTLCYMKELLAVSACRLCVVEVEGQNKLMTACSTPAEEGMVVRTETERVVGVRRAILQLILDNHPNDCLTCNKAGNCELQKHAYRYDVEFREHTGEYRGDRSAGYTDTSSPYILRDESKCILCGRCIRTCAEVDDRRILDFAGRGFETRVIADSDETLEESDCVSCGRCVVACPVGALIDKRSQGKGRVWELEIDRIDCEVCSYGCEMELLRSKGEVVAVRPGKPDKGRPLCLKGRLTTEFKHVDRLDQPYEKIEKEDRNVFEKSEWVDVLELRKVYDKLKDIEE